MEDSREKRQPGRPKSNDPKFMLSLRLPITEKLRIEQAASKIGLTSSDFIRSILKGYLNHYDRENTNNTGGKGVL